MTNSILYQDEDKTYYVVYSDKFGEIYLKGKQIHIYIIIDVKELQETPKLLYGHSDPISFMKMSSDGKTLISADTYGKIKVCEFPNVFNFQSVLFYNDEYI